MKHGRRWWMWTLAAGLLAVTAYVALLLRILEEEARVQAEAVKAAQESVTLTTDQYRAGTASYLNVVVVQATALTAELPLAAEVTAREQPAPRAR